MESTTDQNGAGIAEAFPFAAGASGSTASVTVYIDSHDSATKLTAGLYASASNGQPGSLIASGSLTSPRASAWNTVTVSSAAITSGQMYWMAVLGTGGTLDFRDRKGGPCDSFTSSQSNLKSLASSWTSGGTWNTCPISAFVSASPNGVTPAPVDTAVPALSGTAQQGLTLTSSAGSWSNRPTSYAYAWEDCGTSGSSCTPIAGAASSSYTLQASDVGDTIRSQVTAANAGGSATATSAASSTVVGSVTSPPADTSAPTIFGTFQQGDMLIESHGTWTNRPTSYSYQWEDCNGTGGSCTPISGATSQTYLLTASDAGHSVMVLETASNAAGSGTPAGSAASPGVLPMAPSNSSLPTISGTAAPGQTLTASSGSWTGSPTAYTYRWEDCAGASCTAISGATSASYTVTGTDVGDTIEVVVTATNAGGTVSADSAASAVVTSSSAAPTAAFTSSPSSPVAGSSVQFVASASTCAAGPCTYTWADDPPGGGTWSLGTGQTVSFTFQNVSTKYVTLTVTDAVARTATVEHDVVVAASSVASPTDAAAPTVSGTTQQGHTLTASTGTWTGSPTSYAHQWQDCDTTGSNCAAIGGATLSSYALAASDVGQTVRVQVTATNGGGSASAASAQTAAIAAAASTAPVNTALPVLSGSTTVGQTLSASAGSWTNSPTSYGYQWQLCSSSCANVAGATSASYTQVSGDVGDTLDLVVTASNRGGSASQASAASGVVAAASSGGGGLTNTALPVIHGYTTPNSELFATNGTWSGAPTSYSYQWMDCNSSGANCTDATHTSGLTGDPCSPTSFCYVVGSGDVGDTLEQVVTAHASSGTATATSADVGPAATSEPVPCALTAAAGTDSTYEVGVTGGDHNVGSCWGQQTGITGATGCTEAQIKAGSPVQCGPPYITHISGDQSYSSANTVLANAYITGCVAIQASAKNFTMRDDLVATNSQNCQNDSSNSQGGALVSGNDTSVPAGVLVEDTEVDGLDVGVENDGVLNDFGVILGAGGTMIRGNVHGYAKNITPNGLSGATTTVQDTFDHDPNQTFNNAYDCTSSGGDHFDSHEDPMWMDSSSYVDLQHDYISAVGSGDCATAALGILSDYGAPVHNTINDTFLEGGGAPGGGRPDAYDGKSGVCGTSNSFTNDAFSNNSGPNSNEPITEWAPGNAGNAWSGNTVAETGATIPDPGNSC